MGAFPRFDRSFLTLKEILADLPQPLKGVMTRGFTALGSLPEESRNMLAAEVKKNITNISDLDVPKLATTLGVEEDVAGLIASATSLLMALATSRTEDSALLVAGLVEEEFVKESSRHAALHVLEVLASDRESLKQSMKIDSLAAETIPSFNSLSTSTDLRLRFKDGEIELVVPAVIAHLTTDHSETNCFFQLKKSDIVQLIDQLQKILEQIEKAERWAQRG